MAQVFVSISSKMAQVNISIYICQEIQFKESTTLDELHLKFNNSHYHRSNMALIKIELKNDKDESLFLHDLGGSIINSNKEIVIELNGTRVLSGEKYYLIITGSAGVKYYWEQEKMNAYFVRTKSNLNIPFVMVNGETQENSYLWFQLR